MECDHEAPFGYHFGSRAISTSPVSLAEFHRLCQTIGFGDEDRSYLRNAGEILEKRVDAYLDRWYEFTASLPHMSQFSEDREGKPLAEYRAASRQRFREWILDTCRRPFDQDWLNYQHEIGLRHHRTKKNQTDRVESAPHIGLRYVLAQTYPFAATLRDFLRDEGYPSDDVEQIHQAWSKAVLLSVILWSFPYVKDGDF